MNNQKPKRKINKINLWAIIVSCIAVFAFICLLGGVAVIASLLQDKPNLNLQDFEQQESSIVYDQNGEEIANLGAVIRQNIEYDDLPNCVIDAFVSIEDSRFFEHNGFDLPRFTKAAIDNVLGGEIVSGGSTFTMQLVKNTYFMNDETGEEAARNGVSGIRRKVQEIALAMELENYEPKQFIIESYINKLNYGSDKNIRGIQKAAQYYFGKDASNLNVNEAAFLAGVINGPYLYCPFSQDSDGTYHIEEAQAREEAVLYQMYNHGYLSKTEYELAMSVQLVDLLSDPYKSNSDSEGIPYQAYIDAVVTEAIELTGQDPYTTTMYIYTYMNKDIQNVMDEIQASGKEDYVGFPDDYMEAASVCINNATGEVVGILGGRNYSNGGQLLLNHATEQYKQPGSSIKPILDYCLAFENLGWATDHVLHDVPMYMDSSKQNLVYNFSGTYVGDVTLKDAVGQSINTCAIQTLQAVLDKMKYEYVVNYAQSLGYEFNLDRFNVQYAVGGSTCEVTPMQHAAAYAAIMNGGVYNTPHTISKIVFTNGKSPITPTYESVQAVSEQAAYLTTELMKSNVESYGGSYSYVKNSEYTVYGKTGTTDWSGDDGKPYGIPNGANKDAWLVAATSEYTTATWVGYEKAVKGQPSYITDDVYYNVRPQARISHLILDACYEYGDKKPTEISKPSGISSITHIINTWPYASTSIDGVTLPEEYITTGLIKTDSLKLVKLTAPDMPELKEATAVIDSNGNTISMTWSKLSGEYLSPDTDGTQDTSLVSATGEVIVAATGKILFSPSWIYGAASYKADILADGKLVETVSSNDHEKSFPMPYIEPGSEITVELYYSYENSSSKSNKITVKLGTSEISFKLTEGMSEDELKAFADKYSCITFEEGEPSSTETSYFEFYKVGDSSTSLIGQTVTVKDDSKYKIIYHEGSDFSIQLRATDPSESVVITATSGDKTFSWSVSDSDGLIVNGDDGSSTCSISKSFGATTDPITVTVYCENDSGHSSSIEVTIY